MGKWNYRVCVERIQGSNQEYLIHSIRSVYYDDELNPVSYSDPALSLGDYETLADLKNDYKKLGSALNKPIIDLDNFPEEILNKKQQREKDATAFLKREAAALEEAGVTKAEWVDDPKILTNQLNETAKSLCKKAKDEGLYSPSTNDWDVWVSLMKYKEKTWPDHR